MITLQDAFRFLESKQKVYYITYFKNFGELQKGVITGVSTGTRHNCDEYLVETAQHKYIKLEDVFLREKDAKIIEMGRLLAERRKDLEGLEKQYRKLLGKEEWKYN